MPGKKKRQSGLPCEGAPALPVAKGDKVELAVEGLGHSGEGVARLQGFTVFVPFALPGERVTAAIEEVKKNYARARLKAIVEASPDRVDPLCPVFWRCGGCQLQHMAYHAQLAAKRQRVIDALARIGGLSGVPVRETIGMADPWHYRNKAQLPVGMAGGRLAGGFFAPGTHDIVPIDACLIQRAENNAAVKAALAAAVEAEIPAYDEQTGKGVLRHILCRVGTASGEVMVLLVTATAELPEGRRIVRHLREKIPNLASVQQNINPARTNVILGSRTRLLWGRETITERVCGLEFDVSAASFFQINTVQAEVLYGIVQEYAGLTGTETLADVYCGTGTIALCLAPRAKEVIGIEEAEAAVRDARQNARRNGIANASFLAGDAAEVLPRLVEDGLRPDVVVLDPPRAGCARQVLDALAKVAPRRIVYVSCDPASLARDLAILSAAGFSVREAQPVDMFPQTSHVECVALIERKSLEI